MTDSESTVTDAIFNMDVDLQIVNVESSEQGYSVLLDYKGVRTLFLFSVIPVQN